MSEQPPKKPGIIEFIHMAHGKRPVAESPALLEKADAVTRLDRFITYELGQADETLRKLPEDGSNPNAVQAVIGAHYHWDLVQKAKELRKAFVAGAEG
jgi:hypothetical protein